jgi:hypothetical protein
MPDTDVYPSQRHEELIRLSICDVYSPKVCSSDFHMNQAFSAFANHNGKGMGYADALLPLKEPNRLCENP